MIKGACDIDGLVSAILILKISINNPNIYEQRNILNVIVTINLKVDKFLKKVSTLFKNFVKNPSINYYILIITQCQYKLSIYKTLNMIKSYKYHWNCMTLSMLSKRHDVYFFALIVTKTF